MKKLSSQVEDLENELQTQKYENKNHKIMLYRLIEDNWNMLTTKQERDALDSNYSIQDGAKVVRTLLPEMRTKLSNQ